MGAATLTRLSIFLGVLVLFLILESLFPARKRVLPRLSRWFTNLSMSALGSVTGALMSPVLALSVAALAASNGWGLLNQISINAWIEGAIAIVLLDFAIWAQHVAFHYVPWLWRLHSVHHTDRDLDATSGIRFHPGEIAVSLLWKAVAILALGPSVLAVFIFEIILNAGSIYTHSNISLPSWLDRTLRTLFVTPDMHRVHHSVVERETNSNFGFNFSIWDRIFRTYRRDAQAPLTLGLSEHQSSTPARLGYSLWLPFRKDRP